MADFRRWILAFAALVLVLGLVAPASAQYSIVCNTQFSGPNLRAEGFTELVGEIDMYCSPGLGQTPTPSPTPIAKTNITVSLSAPLTSRLMGTSGATEALLTIDTPTAANGEQLVCPNPTAPSCTVIGDGGAPFNPTSNAAKYNVFQGITGGPGSQSVTFLGVPIDAPTTSTRIYRIQNLRVNATGVAASLYGLSPVVAFVQASPSSSIQINSPSGNVGYVSLSLSTTIKSKNGPFLECIANTSQTVIGTVNFTELFQTAFKVAGRTGQGNPGQSFNTESGLEILIPSGDGQGGTTTASNTTGLADTGTKLQVVFANIPAGVNLWVDGYALSAASPLSDATWNTGTGTVTSAPATGLQQLATAGGSTTTATAIWEVTNANANATDSYTFNVYASYKAAAPAAGVTLTGVAGYSPQLAAYSSSGPIPEFAIVTTAPTGIFTVALCQTVLLFPYVTDFYGFDTGIAISNTSLDSLAAAFTATPQSGTCSVTFFGGGGIATTLGTAGVYSSTADTALTNGVIAAGQTWAFSMSTIDPGYNSAPTYGTTGYAIATCNFQYGHGYSFVSDTGIRNFAAAYLALIIPDGVGRNPVPFSANAAGQPGEQHS